MSKRGRFLPSIGDVSSSLDVELSVVLELAGLGNVLLVPRCLLGIIGVTDLLVFSGSQASRDIRVGANLGNLEL